MNSGCAEVFIANGVFAEEEGKGWERACPGAKNKAAKGGSTAREGADRDTAMPAGEVSGSLGGDWAGDARFSEAEVAATEGLCFNTVFEAFAKVRA